MSKKEERFQVSHNALTLGKFLPVIGSDALDHIAAQEVKPLDNLSGARLGVLANQFADNREAACPIYQRNDCSVVALVDNGINLPMSTSFAGFDLRWALINRNPIGYLTTLLF